MFSVMRSKNNSINCIILTSCLKTAPKPARFTDCQVCNNSLKKPVLNIFSCENLRSKNNLITLHFNVMLKNNTKTSKIHAVCQVRNNYRSLAILLSEVYMNASLHKVLSMFLYHIQLNS